MDHPHYRERSAEVRTLIGEMGVPIEPLSLDEAYIDLSGVSDPVARMSDLVGRIREETGLDASVGIGPNKLVAKVASDAEKPRGFVVLTREQAAVRFASEGVRLIPGIGPKTAGRLEGFGVKTIGQLQRCTIPGLIERFGESHGRALHDRAHFRSDAPVTTERIAKSRSVETTFDYDVTDPERLVEVVSGQAERLAGQLRDRDISGRTIGIKVRTDDFATFTRDRSIQTFTNDPETIRAVALELLRENLPDRPVRLLGVRIAKFADEAPAPAEGAPSLLDPEA